MSTTPTEDHEPATTRGTSSQPADPATSPSASPAAAATPPRPPSPAGDLGHYGEVVLGDYGPRIKLHAITGDDEEGYAGVRYCNRCGVLVGHSSVHDAWHRAMARLMADQRGQLRALADLEGRVAALEGYPR